jgi:hypothetical protein
MSKVNGRKEHNKVVKRTSQGGKQPKTSTMGKTKKKGYKKYRGQGK